MYNVWFNLNNVLEKSETYKLRNQISGCKRLRTRMSQVLTVKEHYIIFQGDERLYFHFDCNVGLHRTYTYKDLILPYVNYTSTNPT